MCAEQRKRTQASTIQAGKVVSRGLSTHSMLGQQSFERVGFETVYTTLMSPVGQCADRSGRSSPSCQDRSA